ncbi:MAG TPA: NHL repeat-containing protein, partial [Nitrospiria bacterium]|nr:NHL repeat-containing protein [Nitrospiria bacterium]
MKIGVMIRVRGAIGALLGAALLWSCSSSSGGVFNLPIGVAIDSSGNIYIADSANNRIVSMSDMNGANWTPFGSMGSGRGQFITPSGVAVDSSGNVYVADLGNNRIVKTNMTGTIWIPLSTNPNNA